MLTMAWVVCISTEGREGGKAQGVLQGRIRGRSGGWRCTGPRGLRPVTGVLGLGYMLVISRGKCAQSAV
jgi:hypothetical protein